MAGSGLAIVMFTDLVGSTRMRERLGDDVADEIGIEHDRIIGDALSSTGGRLVKNLGDGALVVFDSSVDAVVAGQRIQEGVSVYNGQAEEARQIGVRIGINAGEVATDDGDVIGLPVAVASRVCDKADGGQILVTDTVRSLIGRRARFPYLSIGSHVLKGVDDPVVLWSIEEAPPAAGSSSFADIPFPAFLARSVPGNLVGRDEELERLDAAHAAAADGIQLVVVIGEPGIGKTSLTSTWCKSAVDAGLTVVGGRCTPDAGLPYQPFVEIARTVLRARPGLMAEIGPAAGNIAQLVPGIEMSSDLPAPIQTDPDTTRYLMAEAFAALLESGDREPPRVVVLDDLHWADEHTVSVLSHLARRDELSALIISTYRDTDLTGSHPLPRLLTDLRREHRLVRVSLQRLSDDEVKEMISSHFGADTAPDIAESIAEETQGNPFFVAEITTHLQDEGAIDDGGHWISDTPIGDYGIPEGVREVVGRRLDHLGEDVVSVLEVAAVIGPSFSVDVAGAIAGLDERAVDSVVEAAMNARLITEGDDADQFAFAHALLRQTLYDGLTARRRMRIHRAVGEALEARGEPPAVLLNHWLTANDNERSLACALDAASAAASAFAGSDITAHLELALDVWDDVDEPERVAGISHAELVMRLADTRFDFGTNAASTNELIRSELDGDDIDDTTRALLFNSLGRMLSAIADSAGAHAARAEALRLVPKDPPNAAHAEILASVASSLAVGIEAEGAIRTAREALEMARSVGSRSAEQPALQALATASQTLGRLEDADGYYDELSDLAATTGVLRYQLVGYVNQASGLGQNGYLDEALRLTEEGIARTSDLGVTRWEAMLRGNAASYTFDLGRWDESEKHLTELEPSRELDFPQINVSLAMLTLAAERGDDRTTARELDRLGSFIEAGLDSQMRGQFWECRASDLRWHGDAGEAYGVGAERIEALDSDEAWALAPRLAAFVIEAAADAAEAGVAEAAWIDNATAWQARFAEVSAPMLFAEGFQSTAVADLSRAEGNNDPNLWRAAVESWGDQAYYGAKARWRLAQALIEANPTSPEIADSLNQAEEVAERLKAEPLLEAVRATRASIVT